LKDSKMESWGNVRSEQETQVAFHSMQRHRPRTLVIVAWRKNVRSYAANEEIIGGDFLD
jgi:hypothetical protein